MASLGRERAATVVNELIEAREGVERLKSFLMQLGDRRAPWTEQVADGVLNRLSNVMSALDGAAAGGQSSDGARPQPSASSSGRNRRKRNFSRRSQHAYEQRITATLDDGHIWRKYGQKEIQNSSNPRGYFRCTHRSDQGCPAKRQVQRCDADPSKHVVTYYGEHTCRDPSQIVPIVIHAAGDAPPDGGASNLISFALSRANAGSNNGGASSSQTVAAVDGSATQLSTSSWCTSDDVSAGSFMQVDELGAVVGSAAGVISARKVAAGSAPDDADTMMPGLGGVGTGTGAGSFPSSPNSLGFEVGDDDLFRLDLDPQLVCTLWN
ncbi:hypothetical protein PR202_gb19786 [Eleusine coracana subsp. coracana]|uniref:WRKY domain-containing protein n=1 Tax=Eleusine coracana subsp. coracana TaxID=191504 RepID=A0AAV5F948_ELECO|nr:hypothetical protein QOZ80_3BG0280920 [Eleusine coracana subsp. coracana]GJN31392.1 hypothetical protein PR202_gb19786 [Eleusine coracana subsp. coracana]